MNFIVLKAKSSKLSRLYYRSEDVIYKLRKRNSKTIYFKCIHPKCNCRGKVSNNVFSRVNSEIHNHTGDMTVAEYELAMRKFQYLALKTTRPLREIYDEVSASLSLEAAGLFDWKHTRHVVQKIRRSFRLVKV